MPRRNLDKTPNFNKLVDKIIDSTEPFNQYNVNIEGFGQLTLQKSTNSNFSHPSILDQSAPSLKITFNNKHGMVIYNLPISNVYSYDDKIAKKNISRLIYPDANFREVFTQEREQIINAITKDKPQKLDQANIEAFHIAKAARLA